VSRKQPFQKANRIYSIKLVSRVTNPREYETKVTGDHERSFRVGITPTQNTRHGVITDIRKWCEQHFDQLPKEGELIVIDLDEVRRA
jgi:hypothetical protein